MLWDTFWEWVALLYYLCFLLLASLALFISLADRRRSGSRRRLRHVFRILALSLLLWQITLFLEVRTTLPAVQLWLGRVNFAAVVFVVYLALRFIQEVPMERSGRRVGASPWLLAETVLLAVLTLLTPLIDAVERVEEGHAITTFGPLFPGYLLHVLGTLAAAIILAFQERRRAENRTARRQFTLIGMGMLATGSIAAVANVLLPYGFGDFRFCDIGALSTLLFVLTIAYATFLHGLFDLRIVLRETLVYGLLLTFVLGAYSSAIFLVSEVLTSDTGKVTRFAVLLIAFSFDPLRRFLEAKTDRLLFGRREAHGKKDRRKG